MPPKKKGNGQKPTIRTVSELAGVSVATVSRVLNAPWSVREERRNRVLESMKLLNYSPDPVARALCTHRVRVAAIAVPNIVNPCLAEVIRGVIETLEHNGFDVLIFDSNQSIERERMFIEVLHNKIIDGVIIAAISTKELNYSELAAKTSVVVIDHPEAGHEVDLLYADDRGGMQKLVDHLKSLGHRKIGFLSGSFNSMGGVRRTESFKHAMQSAGLETSPENIVECEWNLYGGAKGITTFLSRKTFPTAFICASDLIAIGALGTAYSMGFRVPRDFSITGFDHAPWSEFSIPPLTTLEYPNYRIGKDAAECLLRRVDSPQAPRIVKKLELPVMIRKSTGPCSLE